MPSEPYRLTQQVAPGDTIAVWRKTGGAVHRRLARVLYFDDHTFLEYTSGKPERVPPGSFLYVVRETGARLNTDDDF